MIAIRQRHGQTDGLTDTKRSQYRAMHYSASRGNLCSILPCLGYIVHDFLLKTASSPGCSLREIWEVPDLKAPKSEGSMIIIYSITFLVTQS